MSWPIIPDNVVFDLDDAQDKANGLTELFYLKHLYPKFKCTLFAIPALCSESLFKIYDSLDWIELAVHGWDHHDNWEAKDWTKEECLEALSKAETSYPGYVKGYKSPGWQISDGCYQALLEAGCWVADQDYNNGRRPKELPTYLLSHPWSIHGHTWDITGVPKDQQNGIHQLIYERELKFGPKTEFHFISEVVGGGEVNTVSLDDSSSVNDAAVVEEEPKVVDGSVARFGDDRVFLIAGKKASWIKNPETLSSLGFEFKSVENYDSKKFSEFEEGEPIDLKTNEDVCDQPDQDPIHREVSNDTLEVQRSGNDTHDSDRPVAPWDL